MTPTVANVSRQPPPSNLLEARRAPSPGSDRRRAALAPADQFLDHLAELATMIALLERLPDLSGDLGDWRRFAKSASQPDAVGERNLPGYAGLDPVIRRAFNAVVTGLDKLAESAVDLCEHKHDPPTPGEIEACAEIGASMRPLLERALALVESVRPSIEGDARS
jgi:hypothetical protein